MAEDTEGTDARAEADERSPYTPAELERRERALEQIVQLGDPVLRTSAVGIDTFDRDLVALAAHMVALMDDAIGVGLAAPQIGRPIRMFVYRADGEGEARAIVNPVVEPVGEELETMEEGCLSLVGVHVPVERPVSIRLTGSTVDGKAIDERVDGFSARIIQHETDHLNGVLILERTTPEARRTALRALRDGVAADPLPGETPSAVLPSGAGPDETPTGDATGASAPAA